MKKVALIGDSIRMGYQSIIKQNLCGAAFVWMPDINGVDSRNILIHLSRWMKIAQPDIVHINCGLHDMKKPFDTGIPAVPLEEYQHNIHTILSQLTQTIPVVVWVTTTPVNTVWHHQVKTFDRFEEDVIAYNAAAQDVARAWDVQVNDLYTAVMSAGRDRLLLPDGVHFNEKGCALLAEQVTLLLNQFL